MKNSIKNFLLVIVLGLFIFAFSFMFLFGKDKVYSETERRVLENFPELSVETVLDGTFMDKLETYSLDQFPFRDAMRKIKAFAEYFVFGNSEVNDYYLSEGHISKIEYPKNDTMLDNSAKVFNKIYEKYLKDTDANIYFSMVPDKGAYLADKAGVLKIDYKTFAQDMLSRFDKAEYIDVFDMLSAEDYYFTDPHWRQEKITDIAEHLSNSMGNAFVGEYTVNELDVPFCGAYYSQAALPSKSEKLYYLTNDIIDSCIVKNVETSLGTPAEMYNMEKAHGRDPYEMYLEGSRALITIENPLADNDEHLVLFRDSFGSSIAPLLTQGYAKITVVDIRYISSDVLSNFVDFESADDVLFLYSTVILNNSLAFK